MIVVFKKQTIVGPDVAGWFFDLSLYETILQKYKMAYLYKLVQCDAVSRTLSF